MLGMQNVRSFHARAHLSRCSHLDGHPPQREHAAHAGRRPQILRYDRCRPAAGAARPAGTRLRPAASPKRRDAAAGRGGGGAMAGRRAWPVAAGVSTTYAHTRACVWARVWTRVWVWVWVGVAVPGDSVFVVVGGGRGKGGGLCIIMYLLLCVGVCAMLEGRLPPEPVRTRTPGRPPGASWTVAGGVGDGAKPRKPQVSPGPEPRPLSYTPNLQTGPAATGRTNLADVCKISSFSSLPAMARTRPSPILSQLRRRLPGGRGFRGADQPSHRCGESLDEAG